MKKQVKAAEVLITLNVVIFLLAELISGSTENTSVLITWGGAYVPYIQNGAYWRLFTAMFMHSGIRHLLNNMLLLYVMGEHLETLIGSVRFAALYLLSGLSANIAAYCYYVKTGQAVVSVGASGAIYAVIGALLLIIIRCRGKADGLSLKQMLILLALSLYFGFVAANVSNIAHIFGLISGFLLCLILWKKPEETER